MCLYTKQKEPIILEDDLVVYKVLLRRNVTPFQHRILYTGFLYDTNSEIENIEYIGNAFIIEKGFFHSYLTAASAFNLVSELKFFVNKYANVYKALIPKGTKCYFGIANDIASKQIKILEECV